MDYERIVTAIGHIDAAVAAIDDTEIEDDLGDIYADLIDQRNALNDFRLALIGGKNDVQALLDAQAS